MSFSSITRQMLGCLVPFDAPYLRHTLCPRPSFFCCFAILRDQISNERVQAVFLIANLEDGTLISASSGFMISLAYLEHLTPEVPPFCRRRVPVLINVRLPFAFESRAVRARSCAHPPLCNTGSTAQKPEAGAVVVSLRLALPGRARSLRLHLWL